MPTAKKKPTTFQPSQESLPLDPSLSALRYLVRASVALEQHATKNEVPEWVKDKILQSAQSLSTAVAYLQYTEKAKKEEKKP